MSNNTVTRETYVDMPSKDKLNILFDISTSTDRRLKVLEKRKRLDTTFAGAMGLAGGALVMGFRWIFGR